MFVQQKFAKHIVFAVVVANAIGCTTMRQLAHQIQSPSSKRSAAAD